MTFGYPNRETSTWIGEVGQRAALHGETLPRDARWFAGLAEKAGWK